MIRGPLVVTGTGTAVGKTVVTAALTALGLAADLRVAVVKAAQTGVGPDEPADLDEVHRLVQPGLVGPRSARQRPGKQVTYRELGRYPDPLAPATAARRAGIAPVTPAQVAAAAGELATCHDLVLVEGAGGLLVHLDADGGTLAQVAASLDAPVLVVAAASLGTLNHTALTVEALRTRRLRCVGVVIGSWPNAPDLAARCNLVDLPTVTGVPLLGMLTEGAARLTPSDFHTQARQGLAAELGGRWCGPCRA